MPKQAEFTSPRLEDIEENRSRGFESEVEWDSDSDSKKRRRLSAKQAYFTRKAQTPSDMLLVSRNR
jgi:hypothetical protein